MILILRNYKQSFCILVHSENNIQKVKIIKHKTKIFVIKKYASLLNFINYNFNRKITR